MRSNRVKKKKKELYNSIYYTRIYITDTRGNSKCSPDACVYTRIP